MDAHHVIQDAAAQGLDGYRTNSKGKGLDSPAVYLPPGDHALANAVQNTAAGGGSFADERAIAKKALEDAGCTEDEIERALREVDRYFKDVLDAENSTQWVRPVNRP